MPGRSATSTRLSPRTRSKPRAGAFMALSSVQPEMPSSSDRPVVDNSGYSPFSRRIGSSVRVTVSLMTCPLYVKTYNAPPTRPAKVDMGVVSR